MVKTPAASSSWVGNPLIRRGWQHDGSDPMNPCNPGNMPQKIPLPASGARGA